MADYLRRSWAVVDLDRLERNVLALRKTMKPGCGVMGVVKADAYGHGSRYVAQALAEHVEWFGVSNIKEAIALRKGGVSHPILIFGPTPPEYASRLGECRLTQTVHTVEYASQLQKAAEREQIQLRVHLKVDTGMSRLGFVAGDNPLEDIRALCAMANLQAEGIYTHFAVADESSKESEAFTRSQFAAFQNLLAALEEQGIHFRIRHCCNSAGSMRFPEMHLDLVRPGIMLYGLNPGEGCLDTGIPLEPALEWYATVTMVKEISPGTGVSYGLRYTAEKPARIATVPLGYADGFARDLSNRGSMLVRGKLAPVAGRVCMDQLMLDVTDIEGVTAGDLVTIVGEDGGSRLTLDQMAELSGTIHYEKACQISRRIPRVYRRNGREVAAVDYADQIE